MEKRARATSHPPQQLAPRHRYFVQLETLPCPAIHSVRRHKYIAAPHSVPTTQSKPLKSPSPGPLSLAALARFPAELHASVGSIRASPNSSFSSSVSHQLHAPFKPRSKADSIYQLSLQRSHKAKLHSGPFHSTNTKPLNHGAPSTFYSPCRDITKSNLHPITPFPARGHSS